MGSSTGLALCCLACLLGSAAGNMVSPGLFKCLDIQADKKEGSEERETVEDMKAKTGKINVQLYKCHDQHNQDWEIVDGQIKSESLDRCLTVDGAVAANANVVLLECGGDNAALQKWDLTGASYVKSAGSEFCLDVEAALVDGKRETFDEIKKHTTVNVHLFDCHDPDTTKRVNQLWEWAPFTGDAVVEEVASAWQFLGGAVARPAASGHASVAVAAVGAASLFVAGIFVGLRKRQAAVQPPMAGLSLE